MLRSPGLYGWAVAIATQKTDGWYIARYQLFSLLILWLTWHSNKHVRGRHDFISRVATLVIFAPHIIFTLIIRKIAYWIRAFVKSSVQKQMLLSSTADTNDIAVRHFKIIFLGGYKTKKEKISVGRGRRGASERYFQPRTVRSVLARSRSSTSYP